MKGQVGTVGLRDHFGFGSISSSCYARDVGIIT